MCLKLRDIHLRVEPHRQTSVKILFHYGQSQLRFAILAIFNNEGLNTAEGKATRWTGRVHYTIRQETLKS